MCIKCMPLLKLIWTHRCQLSFGWILKEFCLSFDWIFNEIQIGIVGPRQTHSGIVHFMHCVESLVSSCAAAGVVSSAIFIVKTANFHWKGSMEMFLSRKVQCCCATSSRVVSAMSRAVQSSSFTQTVVVNGTGTTRIFQKLIALTMLNLKTVCIWMWFCLLQKRLWQLEVTESVSH